MRYEHILVTTHAGLGTITMNRPERRNALSEAHMRELLDAFRTVWRRTRRCAPSILAANGPVFCAGHDFADMVERDLDGMRRLLEVCTRADADHPGAYRSRWSRACTASPPPRAASWSPRADLAVAAEEAAFAAPGGRGGWFCHTPMVAIARTVGRKRALEMAFTGDPIDAQTALAWGLVNRVVPRGASRRGDRASRARRQPRQPGLEGPRQAGPLRHDRPRRGRRLRARRRGDGDERPRRRRPRGDAVVPGEASRRLSAAPVAPAPCRRCFLRVVSLSCRDAMTTPVAYFCMEFGLSEEFPIYAGGLGILAGDFIKSAHDLGLPVVGVGLRWARGYSRQRIGEDGLPVSEFPSYRADFLEDTGVRVRVRVDDTRGRGARVAYRALGQRAAPAPRAGRHPRRLDHEPALRSDVRLPRGAGDPARRRRRARAAALGIDVERYHFNEGHALFAGIELIAERMRARGATFDEAWAAVREQIVFTTHTPGRRRQRGARARPSCAGSARCCELVDWEMRQHRRRPVQHDGRRRCGCRAAPTRSPSCTARRRARCGATSSDAAPIIADHQRRATHRTWQDARIRAAPRDVADARSWARTSAQARAARRGRAPHRRRARPERADHRLRAPRHRLQAQRPALPRPGRASSALLDGRQAAARLRRQGASRRRRRAADHRRAGGAGATRYPGRRRLRAGLRLALGRAAHPRRRRVAQQRRAGRSRRAAPRA